MQNIKLLSAMAPVVSMEQLVYDCRLMNGAAKDGPESALLLQKWLSDSDSTFDPQAYILRPDVVFEISSRIVHETDPLKRTLLSAQVAIDILKKAIEQNKVSIAPRELKWLDIMQMQLEDIPGEADAFFEKVKPVLDNSKFIPAEYGL